MSEEKKYPKVSTDQMYAQVLPDEDFEITSREKALEIAKSSLYGWPSKRLRDHFNFPSQRYVPPSYDPPGTMAEMGTELINALLPPKKGLYFYFKRFFSFAAGITRKAWSRMIRAQAGRIGLRIKITPKKRKR